MMTSHEIDKLGEALAAAQGEIDSAKKSAANPYFKSKYADLAEVWYAIREALSKNGLAVAQTPFAEYGNFVTRKVKVEKKDGSYDIREITEREAFVTVKTRLIHASGQWIEDELEILPAKSDPQGIGSAITYARRYALAAIVGVAQDDDDGNAASGKEVTAAKQQAKAQQTTKAQGEEKKTWKLKDIKKVISKELQAMFAERRAVTAMVEDYFTAFDGDQQKIMNALKESDVEEVTV